MEARWAAACHTTGGACPTIDSPAGSADRPVTIYDVADRAGVSIATVSRVLRGSTPASALTRQKVLRAVEDLDYVPLRAARQVETHGHEAHGLVLPGVAGPYYSDLLIGYESTAAQYGQSVTVVLGSDTTDLEAAVRSVLGRVDGLAVANDTLDDATVRSLSKSTPTVLIAREPLPGCDTVVVENSRAAHELTTHLIGHGRCRFVFAGDPDISHDISERYRGFRQALSEHGLTEGRPPVRVPYDETAGPALVEALVVAGHGVDAVVCANDELALTALAGLRHRGRAIPDDLALVGFDDIMACRYVDPGLTTVSQPTRALGRWAAIRLHERILGRKRDVNPQILPTRVVVRGSCGCSWPAEDDPRRDADPATRHGPEAAALRHAPLAGV